jgi:mRNA interferase MazF
MIKGDIYYVKIGDEGVGSEQKGDRYAVIVQNNIGNKYSPTVIVAFISTKLHKAKLPTHVEIDSSNSGIPEPSIIMCEQIRTLDKRRLEEKVGHLNRLKKQELDRALRISFGLNEVYNQKIAQGGVGC